MSRFRYFGDFFIVMMQHRNAIWFLFRFCYYLLRFLQFTDIRIFIPVILLLFMLLNFLRVLWRRIMSIKFILMRHLRKLFINIIRLKLNFTFPIFIFLPIIPTRRFLLRYFSRLAITKLSLNPLFIIRRLFHQLL